MFFLLCFVTLTILHYRRGRERERESMLVLELTIRDSHLTHSHTHTLLQFVAMEAGELEHLRSSGKQRANSQRSTHNV